MPQHCRILFSQHPCICLRLPSTAAGQVSSKAPAGPLDNGLPHEAAGALRIHTMAEVSAATPLAPTAADATTAASGRGKLVQGKQSKDPEVKVRALMFCLRQARLGNRRQDGVGSAPLKAARSRRPKEIHQAGRFPRLLHQLNLPHAHSSHTGLRKLFESRFTPCRLPQSFSS